MMQSNHNNVLSCHLVTETSKGPHNTPTTLPFPQKVPNVEELKKAPTNISIWELIQLSPTVKLLIHEMLQI